MNPGGFTVTTHAPELEKPILPVTSAPSAPTAPARVPGYAHPLSEPSPVEMAKNLAKAASRWISAGAPVVSQRTYDERSAACNACSYWNARARAGLGKCKAPGCGCTSLKRWLATERCPHPDGSRWRVDNPTK